MGVFAQVEALRTQEEGRSKVTEKRELKYTWRKDGPQNYLGDESGPDGCRYRPEWLGDHTGLPQRSLSGPACFRLRVESRELSVESRGLRVEG